MASETLALMPPREQTDPIDPVRARAGGRPLDENVDAAILETTWRLLLEEGYARMSIARVAEEARVGRPAIYRRYKDKSELVAAVLERGKERGEVRKDLDTTVAVHALMGSLLYHRLAEGQPKKGWSEHVVDQLWPAFAA